MKKKQTKKIAALNNAYTKEQYAEFQKQQKQLMFRRRRLTLFFAVAFLIFAFSGFQIMRDYGQLKSFEAEKEKATRTSADLTQQVTQLEKEIALLSDEDYAAKVARARFYVSKEGEHVYTIPDVNLTVSGINEQDKATQSQTDSSAQ